MPEIINKQKAPKDILLNSILNEIDEENGVIIKEVVPQKKKTKKKSRKEKEQHPLLRILFYFLSTIIVLFLMFMIVMITLTEEEIAEEKEYKTQIPSNEAAKKFVPKKQDYIEDLSKSSLKEEGNTIVKIMRKKIPVNDKKTKENQRQSAKEALLEQMKR